MRGAFAVVGRGERSGDTGSPAADLAMERYASGDDDAFALVYDEVAPRLLRHLRRHVGSRALAEDLVQQTFLQMHRARGRFIRGAEVVPWAFAIAMRLMIDAIRHERVRARLQLLPPPPSAGPDVVVDADYAARRIERALARLPLKQRQAFELQRLDGLSQHETALALGVSESAVKSLIHRATQALRHELDPDGEST